MTSCEDPMVRVAHLSEYGVAVEELAPMELASLTQPVFCLHCCKIYPFGESVLALDGLIYCPVVGCDGSLIAQIPVVETEQEQDAGQGWSRASLSEQFGNVQPAATQDLVWSQAWTRMSDDELRLALVEAWR